MQIRKIRNKENNRLCTTELCELQRKIQGIVQELEFTGSVELGCKNSSAGLTLRNIRLKNSKFNSYTYENENSSNWYVEQVSPDQPPVAKNMYGLGEQKLKRGKWLQYEDWANLDNSVNELLDELGYSATFISSYGKLREGKEWETK